MGFYKTKVCFFTGQNILRDNEPLGRYIHGFYYVISFKEKEGEIRLTDEFLNKKNQTYLKSIGKDFLELLDANNEWEFFDIGN